MKPPVNASVEVARQLAHEIQSPLTSLELQLAKLHDVLAEPTVGHEITSQCLAELAYAQRLVVSFLELGAPVSAPKHQEVASVLRSVEHRFRPLASSRGIALEVDGTTACAHHDQLATERIVSNLVDNAIKFSPDGGNVLVTTRAGASRVVIEVRDAGIGLTDEARSLVFEPFFRAEREQEGSGLGLAIAQHLATVQGGSLRCESELGCGSSFFLELPTT